MTMYQTSSSSLVDMYAYGAASTPVLESATPAAAMRLAFDRQRLLEFSLRHHAHLPPTVSAPTSAAAALLNPSDFCLPVNSTTATTTTNTDLMENWNTLRHQSHPSVLSSWTSSITDFAPYMHYGAISGLEVRRKNATRESTSTLKAWLCQHIKNPYPTKGEKIMLAIVTRMTLTQVSTWFANARRRLKKDNKMQWSPRQRSGDEDDDEVDDDEDDDGDDDDDDDDDVVEADKTRHDVTADSDDDVTSYLGNGEQRSPLPTLVGDVKPAVDSAFSLPPSRGQPTSADDLLPVPVRSRDEDRSTKPRIWSLVEVATSSDYQQKRADHVVSAEFRHAAEFRPWRTTDAGSWESAAARLAARQAAVISAGNLSTTSSTRWLQNNADNSVTSSTELYRPTV